MPPPGKPTIISREPWHFVGGAVDLWVDVPGDISWDYPEESTTLTDPCSGTPTVVTSEATGGFRTITLTFWINYAANRNAREDDVRALWFGRGPYTVTTPRGTVTLAADPTVGRLRERWRSGHTEFTAGFREVV